MSEKITKMLKLAMLDPAVKKAVEQIDGQGGNALRAFFRTIDPHLMSIDGTGNKSTGNTDSYRSMYLDAMKRLEKQAERHQRVDAEISYWRGGYVHPADQAKTPKEIASIAGTTEKVVQGWIKRGVCPEPDPQGKIDLRLAQKTIDVFKRDGRVDDYSIHQKWGRADPNRIRFLEANLRMILNVAKGKED
jgi:hypothetical protein